MSDLDEVRFGEYKICIFQKQVMQWIKPGRNLMLLRQSDFNIDADAVSDTKKVLGSQIKAAAAKPGIKNGRFCWKVELPSRNLI